MALVKCFECGKQVSSAANSCPHCGENRFKGVRCGVCKVALPRSHGVNIVREYYHRDCLQRFKEEYLNVNVNCPECGQDLGKEFSSLNLLEVAISQNDIKDDDYIIPSNLDEHKIIDEPTIWAHMFYGSPGSLNDGSPYRHRNPICPGCGYRQALEYKQACSRCDLPVYGRLHRYCREEDTDFDGYSQYYHHPLCTGDVESPRWGRKWTYYDRSGKVDRAISGDELQEAERNKVSQSDATQTPIRKRDKAGPTYRRFALSLTGVGGILGALIGMGLQSNFSGALLENSLFLSGIVATIALVTVALIRRRTIGCATALFVFLTLTIFERLARFGSIPQYAVPAAYWAVIFSCVAILLSRHEHKARVRGRKFPVVYAACLAVVVTGVLLGSDALQIEPSGASNKLLLPHITREAHPFEGAAYGTWSARERLPLFREPSKQSEVIGWIQRGEDFVAQTGQVHTLQPTELAAKGTTQATAFVVNDPHDGTIQAWGSGAKVVLTLKKGDRLFQVATFGEGAARYWYRGRFYDINFYNLTQRQWPTVHREGKSEWWVRVRTASGAPGWVVDPNADGMDALGRDLTDEPSTPVTAEDITPKSRLFGTDRGSTGYSDYLVQRAAVCGQRTLARQVVDSSSTREGG